MTLAGMLQSEGLIQAGTIYIDGDGEVIAVVNGPGFTGSGVYVWVALDKSNQPFRVRYVGRYSKSLAIRCKQHTAGFNSRSGSRTGQKNAMKIRNDLGTDVASFAIYAASSNTSIQKELDLFKKFYGGRMTDLWNVSGMRSIAKLLGFY